MGGLVSQKGYGIGLPQSNKVISPLSLTIFDLQGNEVGFITDLSYETTRTVERIRHLNAFDAGRIIEQVPVPENFTVSGTGYSLYTDRLSNPQSVIGRLTQELREAVFEVLNAQRIPFNVVKEVSNFQTGITVKTIFFDCWLTRFSEGFSVRNAVVTASFSFQPSYIESEIITRTGMGGKQPIERS